MSPSDDSRRPDATAETSASRDEALAFLDAFRAGESLGEAALGAWIEVCEDPGLRGSLRVIQMREGFHARLLEARIKELGGAPQAEVPEAIMTASLEQSASRQRSDREKLEAFLAQFPDTESALRPIHALADRLDEDPETQHLLRTICQDERATLECLQQHREALAGSGEAR